MQNKDENFFIKTSDVPIESLSREQKAKLNRKGNKHFNSGDIASAARIFMTTGYSDGLSRIGDYYMLKNEKLTALKYYKLAHNKANVDLIVEEIAQLIKVMINN
ncbi:MAG: hypothetical protein CR988_07320 [Treponema sp.]|nr:MAG: hypothetical protein CR988_07320 [Treponema sp.]